MNRRKFFKSLGALLGVAVVAPKVLLAKSEPEQMTIITSEENRSMAEKLAESMKKTQEHWAAHILNYSSSRR